MDKVKVCVVTAIRAEYGLLRPLILRLQESEDFAVSVAVTGAHLSPEFGLTYQEIEQDGINIDKKIEILLSADTPSAVSKSMGLAMLGFADYFASCSFDAVVLLGDRYETLAVACAAMNARIPIVHLYGGEITEGALDDGIRHAITKLSYLHMTSTEEYRRRVIQLGEQPNRVWTVGAIGIENALHLELPSLDELSESLAWNLRDREYVVVTFHPVTLEDNTAEEQAMELLAAIDVFPDLQFIVTKANADEGGRVINKLCEDYAIIHDNMRVYPSLGVKRYLAAVKHSVFVLGNSSSGLIEVPSFQVPTVNIGDRQEGRLRADSVIDCQADCQRIVQSIRKAIRMRENESLRNVSNPYGDGCTTDKILMHMREGLSEKTVDLQKKFFDIGVSIEG